MKFLPKIIKGLLLSALAIAVFNLNMGETVKPVVEVEQNIVATQELSMGDVFGIEVWAAEEKSQAELALALKEAEEAKEAAVKAANAAKTKEEIDKADLEAIVAAENLDKARAALNPTENAPFISKAQLEKVAQTLNWSHYLFQPLIFFFANNIGNLMGNDYIFGGAIGGMLKGIWVISRNIVNILFVLILLYLAIKQIFFGGEGDGSATLKKTLPKFVIMLIAINFSWLGVKLVIDAGNVATNVVFAIPSGLGGTANDFLAGQKCTEDPKTGKPKSLCMPNGAYFTVDSTKTVNHYGDDCPKKEDVEAKPEDYKERIFCWIQLDYTKYSKNNAAMYMTYGISKVQNLTKGNITEADLRGITKVAISFVFSLVLEVVYLITFFALFLAVIIRVAALWLFAAFSPFLVLIIFLKDLPEIGIKESGKFSIKALVSWAFLPAMIGAVMSVGFIMITAGQVSTDALIAKFGTGKNTMSDFSTFFGAMDNVQQLIWYILTVVILWIGVFGVIGEMPGVSFVFQKIKGYAEGTGRAVAKAGLYAPVFGFKEDGSARSIGSEILPGADIQSRIKKLTGKWKGDPDKLADLNDKVAKFKNKDKDGINADKIRKAITSDNLPLASRLIKEHVGISDSDFSDIGDVHTRNVLKDIGITDTDHQDRFGKYIKEGAKGVSPTDTAKVPLTQKNITDGFTAALKNSGLTLGEHKYKDSEKIITKEEIIARLASQNIKTEKLTGKHIKEAVDYLRTQAPPNAPAADATSSEPPAPTSPAKPTTPTEPTPPAGTTP